MPSPHSVDTRFATLTTPLVADGALRAGVAHRLAPSGLRPVHATARACAGRVLAVKHRGSVDVMLEACARASAGEVMVIDNDGRRDQGCIGDLVTLEAWSAGLAGILVWGLHRDTVELQGIPLPVFTYGSYPAGPVRVDPPDGAATTFGDVPFVEGDYVFADEDGAIFVESARVEEVLDAAEHIARTERRQAEVMRGGRTLRAQMRFDDYLAERARDPSYTLRRHLAILGAAVEI